jgi:hypothetical protein
MAVRQSTDIPADDGLASSGRTPLNTNTYHREHPAQGPKELAVASVDILVEVRYDACAKDGRRRRETNSSQRGAGCTCS